MQEAPEDLDNSVVEGYNYSVAARKVRRQVVRVLGAAIVRTQNSESQAAQAKVKFSVGEREINMTSCYLPFSGVAENEWLAITTGLQLLLEENTIALGEFNLDFQDIEGGDMVLSTGPR